MSHVSIDSYKTDSNNTFKTMFLVDHLVGQGKVNQVSS